MGLLGRIFQDLLEFSARFGLTMRDDPRKVIDLAARTWGEQGGWGAVSIELIEQGDPDALPAVSAVLKNAGAQAVSLTVPGWLFFFHAEVTEPDGSQVPLSPFGAQLLKPERRTERIEVALAPGTGTEARIPVGQLFGLRAAAARKERYGVVVSCELEGGAVVRSNRILV
jgi:hypothetical protein